MEKGRGGQFLMGNDRFGKWATRRGSSGAWELVRTKEILKSVDKGWRPFDVFWELQINIRVIFKLLLGAGLLFLNLLHFYPFLNRLKRTWFEISENKRVKVSFPFLPLGPSNQLLVPRGDCCYQLLVWTVRNNLCMYKHAYVGMIPLFWTQMIAYYAHFSEICFFFKLNNTSWRTVPSSIYRAA